MLSHITVASDASEPSERMIDCVHHLAPVGSVSDAIICRHPRVLVRASIVTEFQMPDGMSFCFEPNASESLSSHRR
jgi:hypothetical protein